MRRFLVAASLGSPRIPARAPSASAHAEPRRTHSPPRRRKMRQLAGFVRTLRDNGFTIGLAETRDALAILASPAARATASLRPALRALFCADHSDFQTLRRDFRRLLDRPRRAHALKVVGKRQAPQAKPRAKHSARPAHRKAQPALPDRVERGAERRRGGGGRGRREGASTRRERLPRPTSATSSTQTKSRARMRSPRGWRERCGRGSSAASRRAGSGRRLDIRRTIHRSISYGGTPVELAWRRRKHKPLRLVVLLDASGSMSLYTAFFVRFLHGVVDAFREAEAFVFHTRLAHVSPSLRDRNVTRAVEKLSLMAQGIGGGTRIGESLATFNRWHAQARHQFAHRRDDRLRRLRHRRAGSARRGDAAAAPPLPPHRLAQSADRLARLRPAARGMQAALPSIDLFAPAHNLESLAALEPYLARI